MYAYSTSHQCHFSNDSNFLLICIFNNINFTNIGHIIEQLYVNNVGVSTDIRLKAYL
jgi:hypothetical protein